MAINSEAQSAFRINPYSSKCMRSISVRFMLGNDPVGDRTMGYDLDRAVVYFQLLFADLVGGVVVQCTVHTGDGLNKRRDRSYIMGYQEDCHGFIEPGENMIQLLLKPVVHIRVGFIEDEQFRGGDDGPGQHGSLQLTPRKFSDGSFFKSGYPDL